MKQLFNFARQTLEAIHPMPQNTLTIRMPIIESKEVSLRAVLNKINQNPASNRVMPFASFSNVHFARFIILEGPEHPKKYASSLFFMANIDGSKDTFIEDMIKHCALGLDQLLSACHAYPEKSKRTDLSRYTYLSTHSLGSQTDYINTVGRSVVMIHQEDELRNVLQDFLKVQHKNRGIVFCKTKAAVKLLTKQLLAKNISVDAIHGDLLQKERDKAMRAFKGEKVQVLISTDVAARGIDVNGLAYVVHYQLPENEEYFTHRSGRTARGGKEGLSICFVHPAEVKKIRMYEQRLGLIFEQMKSDK